MNATVLSNAQLQSLDEQGYVVLPDVLSRPAIDVFIARLQELADTIGNDPSREAVIEDGMIKLHDLINAGELFDICYTHPAILAATSRILGGDIKLHSMGSRSATSGHGHQALHLDFGRDLGQTYPAGCNCVWLLVDFTNENGGTRMVPGSHQWQQNPREEMDDPKQDHPDEICLQAPAGSVVIFSGHTWHGGAQNNTSDIRWAMHIAYCKRDHPQDPPLAEAIHDDVRARLSDESKQLLDL